MALSSQNESMEQLLGTVLPILAWLTIALGFVGNILPILPGAPLMLAGMVFLAYLDSFESIGAGGISALTVLTGLIIAVDILASYLGAKRAGASGLALIGASIGTVVGLFAGLVGVLVAPFLGAFVGELIARGEALRAGKVGFATWVGLVIGAAAKLALAAIMLGVFLLLYFA